MKFYCNIKLVMMPVHVRKAGFCSIATEDGAYIYTIYTYMYNMHPVENHYFSMSPVNKKHVESSLAGLRRQIMNDFLAGGSL